MDAVKFLKEKERMCNKCSACSRCPVCKENNGFNMDCEDLAIENPKEFVAIIEKWSAEHPVKTRQSEFLKMFPDASIGVNGALVIAPCNVNTKFESEICGIGKCEDCKKEYWLAEVE